MSNKVEAFVAGQKIRLGKFATSSAGVLGVGSDPVSDSPESSLRASVDDTIWNLLFPIFLNSWGGRGYTGTFVGQAKYSGTITNVIEITLDSAKKEISTKRTSYFFDSKTHLLLMVSSETSNDTVEVRTNSYYSERKIINGLLIPTKIKIEQKAVMKKEMSILGKSISGSQLSEITDLTVDEFEINLKFPPGTFAIKEKKGQVNR